MKMLNSMEFSSYEISPNAPVFRSWERDVEIHEKLVTERRSIQDLKARLTKRLNLVRRMDSIETPDTRQAVEKDKKITRLRSMTVRTPGRTKTSEETLVRGLKGLDLRLAQVTLELNQIEGRILTHAPENSQEANTMLKFVSGMLQMGHKIERSYLADVLSDCVDAGAKPTAQAPVLTTA